MNRTEKSTAIESAVSIGACIAASALLVLARMERPPQIYTMTPINEVGVSINMRGGTFGWANRRYGYFQMKTGCVPELIEHNHQLQVRMLSLTHRFQYSTETRGKENFDYMRGASVTTWSPKNGSLDGLVECAAEKLFSPVTPILEIGRLEQRIVGTSRFMTALSKY